MDILGIIKRTIQSENLRNSRVITLICGIILIASLTVTSVVGSCYKNIVIKEASGEEVQVQVMGASVSEVLAQSGVEIGEGDEVLPAMDTAISDGDVITIFRAKDVMLAIAGEVYNIRSAKMTVGELLDAEGVVLEGDDALNVAMDTAVESGMRIDVLRGSKLIETVEVNVPFREVRRAATDLNAGETRVVQNGVNGVRKETYEIQFKNGERVGKTLVSSATVVEPVSQIVETGGASAVLAYRGETRYKNVYTMNATGYCACYSCNGSNAGTTATGLAAKRGVVAVDPKVIPLGSRVYVETENGSYVYGTAIAADTGGAIKGYKIDLCFGSHAEALKFGRRTVKVYVE